MADSTESTHTSIRNPFGAPKGYKQQKFLKELAIHANLPLTLPFLLPECATEKQTRTQTHPRGKMPHSFKSVSPDYETDIQTYAKEAKVKQFLVHSKCEINLPKPQISSLCPSSDSRNVSQC